MEHDYQKLFYEIDNILRCDYAGMPEGAARFDPRYYTQAIGQAWNDGKLDELLFLRYVNQMLACMGDRHLRFSLLPGEGYTPYTVGFFVRRCGDALYVTQAHEETRLRPGDCITAVNGGTPAHHRRVIQKNFFYADTPEREDWGGLLKMAQSIIVERLGEIELRHYPRSSTVRKPTLRFLDDTAIFDPGTLDGSGQAAALIAANEAALDHATHIIWDLRLCDGAAEDDLPPLLGWLCTEDRSERELLGDTELYVNYSTRNCALRTAALRNVAGAEAFIRELEAKAGRGFVLECEPGRDTPVRARARRVTVLTDTRCRGAGETLALAARRGGARLIGRPTMGTLDYCQPLGLVLDGRYLLQWPGAVTRQAREGGGYLGRGIEPDVYIPFAPEELAHDVLLDAALAD